MENELQKLSSSSTGINTKNNMKISKSENTNDFLEKKDFRNRKNKTNSQERETKTEADS